jgi:hypothetical protein
LHLALSFLIVQVEIAGKHRTRLMPKPAHHDLLRNAIASTRRSEKMPARMQASVAESDLAVYAREPLG